MTDEASPSPKQHDTMTAAAREALLQVARDVARNSYSPYSKFPVGAALLFPGAPIVVGCNVESASYGLTICAERNAMFSAVAQGLRGATALAVACPTGDPADVNSVMPCGACRQVMSELLHPHAEIIIDGVGSFRLGDLLPRPFVLDTLGRQSADGG